MRSDLYEHGLPRGSVPNPGRLSPSASASANTLALGEHGFALDDSLTLRPESGGYLPAPLSEGIEYFAIPVTDSAFSVSATAGGAVIDFTSPGLRVVVIAKLPIEGAMAWGATLIDDLLPAHIVPLVAPYPPIVVMTNAELAAGKLLKLTGGASKSITELADAAAKRLANWARGVPLRGANAPPAANTAVRAAGTVRDRRNWTRSGRIG